MAVPYRVILTSAARRQLDAVHGTAFLALRGVILSLADEPRPAGTGKLSGRSGLWRIRLRIDGHPWRMVYRIDDKAKTIVITRVLKRDEGTYRGL